jgi:hypothetical protein
MPRAAASEWQYRLIIGINVVLFAYNSWFWTQDGGVANFMAAVLPLIAGLFAAWYWDFVE